MIVLERGERRSQSSISVRAECNSSSPDGSLRKCFEVKAGDDTEVVLATFEGCEKGGVRRSICVDDGGVGEDNLEV